MKMFAALLLAAAAAAAAPALAQMPPRPAADTAKDAARKPAEMVNFAMIKPGSVVADFLPGNGYFTRAFAAAAGPTGKVVAIVPAQAEQLDAASAKTVRDMSANGYPTVSVMPAIAPGTTAMFDVVWTAQNYHDMHAFLPPEAVVGLNTGVFAALKPGGYYVIVDHTAAAGSGTRDAKTLHRLDPAQVKADLTKVGFVFDGETTVLANPADPKTQNVFDPAIRGKTDQFAYRFRKP